MIQNGVLEPAKCVLILVFSKRMGLDIWWFQCVLHTLTFNAVSISVNFVQYEEEEEEEEDGMFTVTAENTVSVWPSQFLFVNRNVTINGQ